ncbi:MAG: hypothetical protein ACLFS4_04270 [Opitutales bacterium]
MNFLRIHIAFILCLTTSVFGDSIKITDIDYKSSKLRYNVTYNATATDVKGDYSIEILGAGNAGSIVLEGRYLFKLGDDIEQKLKLNGTHSKASGGDSASIFFAEDDNRFVLVLVYGKNPDSSSSLEQFEARHSKHCSLSILDEELGSLKNFEMIVLR